MVDRPSWNVAFYFSKPHPNGFSEHLVQKHLFSVVLRGRWQYVKEKNGNILGIWLYLKEATFSKCHDPITFTSHRLGPASRVDPLRPINYNTSDSWNLNKFKPSHLTISCSLSFGRYYSPHCMCIRCCKNEYHMYNHKSEKYSARQQNKQD